LTPTGGGTATTTATSGDGSYTFTHVAAATYDISVIPPTGYTAPPPHTAVAVAATDITGQDFALSRPGSVTGTVTDGANGSPIAGVSITITGTSGTQTATSDADGDYLFAGLAAGTYQLTVGAAAGYQTATPTSRTITITAAGEIVADGDFALTALVPASGATLPNTGADPALVLLGLTLIAVGGATTFAARRRTGTAS
jgi:LPXTG-motif cell wall-anchored protein